MPVRRGLVALLTVAALASCSVSGTGGPAAPSPAAAAQAASAATSAAASPAPASSAVAAASAPALSNQAKAAAFLKRQPGTLGLVVRDRSTGAVWRAGDTTATTWTASTIKLAIATDLLERQRAGQLTLDAGDHANLDKALINSDNDAATALWNKFDGPGMLERFRTRFGMSRLAVIAGYDPFWRNLRCSADDLLAVMTYVLEKLAADDRGYLVNTLRKVAANQHWGVWAAGPSLRPGNKDGWAQKPVDGRTVWVTHSVGFAGDGERYVVAATYQLPPTGTLQQGAHAVSDLIATYFGAPIPAKVTLP